MANVISIPIRSRVMTFDNGDLVDGVLTLTHQLGQSAVSVSIYDADGLLLDSTPLLIDANSCSVNLSLLQPLTGTYTALVQS